MSTEQDPLNNETNQAQERLALVELEFEVARGLENIVLGAYTPAELDDMIISSLRNSQPELRLQAVVNDSANYWLLRVTHHNRSLHAENRNISSAPFNKEISADLLADMPGSHGATGHRFLLTFQVGAQATDRTELFATEGYSTEQTGSPRVIFDHTLLTDLDSAQKVCDRLARVLRNGDESSVYVKGKKADRLVRHHNDYFNL